MGASSSKNNKHETHEQKRRRDIERYGVLIPPVFAISGTREAATINKISNKVNTPRNRTVPLSSQDRLPLSPSLVDYLSASHFGNGLLKDYMTPGMWVLAGGTDPSRNATTTVRAALSLASSSLSSSSSSSQSPQGGQISFSSSPLSSKSHIELCTGTEGPMHIFATHQLFPRAFVFANMNSYGSGYAGGQCGFSFHRKSPSSGTVLVDEEDEIADSSLPISVANNNNKNMDDASYATNNNDLIRIQMGSWVPLDWKSSKRKKSQATLPLSQQSQQQKGGSWLESPQNVNGFLSIDMLGSTTAIESKWNLDTLETQVSKYFSIRLDGGGGAQDNQEKPSSSPPLWLTMTSTPKTSAINISQLLTFDRINFNPLDSRAPRIRNTFGWTVQLEKPTMSPGAFSSTSTDTTMDGPIPSQLSVAAAWQFNRNIGLKLVAASQPATTNSNTPTTHYSCTCGLLLKRWKQPRITCAILGRHDFSTRSFSFVGISLELETDASTFFGGGAGDSFYAAPGAHVSDTDLPETKAVLG